MTTLRQTLEQAQGEVDWRRQAIAWIRGKAAEQAQTNQKYPRHAECYPSWVEKVHILERLAGDLEAESESPPFGLEPWQATHPQASEPAPSTTMPKIGCVGHDCAQCQAQEALEERDQLRAQVAELEKALHNLEVSANTLIYCYDKVPGNFAVAMDGLQKDVEVARDLRIDSARKETP